MVFLESLYGLLYRSPGKISMIEATSLLNTGTIEVKDVKRDVLAMPLRRSKLSVSSQSILEMLRYLSTNRAA